MREVSASAVLEDKVDGALVLRKLEQAARTCYKSEHRITDDSAPKFIRSLINRGHESVIEHEKLTVRIICDRGVSHEIVRHRIGSYSQESTRYCNYANEDFGGELTFVTPSYWIDSPDMLASWRSAMVDCEKHYFSLLQDGAGPEEARSVLPNSLKTEIVVTYNLREWRHFLRMRTSSHAHPQMREIAVDLLAQLSQAIPVVFDDLVEAVDA